MEKLTPLCLTATTPGEAKAEITQEKKRNQKKKGKRKGKRGGKEEKTGRKTNVKKSEKKKMMTNLYKVNLVGESRLHLKHLFHGQELVH